jgi:hypothetical protein
MSSLWNFAFYDEEFVIKSINTDEMQSERERERERGG